MKKIDNWDSVQEAGNGFETLPIGGYVCEIIKACEKPNKTGNGSHLEIWFDIADGEHKGFFTKDYKAQTSEDKFWRGAFYQNIPDETSDKYAIQCQFFKRFTNAVEASNDGYHWEWDEKTLKGKRIGIVFGEVERESKNGTRYMITRPDSVVSVQAVEDGKYRLPKTKYLPNKPEVSFTTMTEDDGDLPF